MQPSHLIHWRSLSVKAHHYWSYLQPRLIKWKQCWLLHSQYCTRMYPFQHRRICETNNVHLIFSFLDSSFMNFLPLDILFMKVVALQTFSRLWCILHEYWLSFFSLDVVRDFYLDLYFLSRIRDAAEKEKYNSIGDTFSSPAARLLLLRSKVALDSYKSHLVNMAAEA